MVHRDLKPENVMVTKTGVKALDFGTVSVRGRSRHGEGPLQAKLHGLSVAVLLRGRSRPPQGSRICCW
jgi:serine/threonine protein kinase